VLELQKSFFKHGLILRKKGASVQSQKDVDTEDANNLIFDGAYN
jgi:hypothetical protein